MSEALEHGQNVWLKSKKNGNANKDPVINEDSMPKSIVVHNDIACPTDRAFPINPREEPGKPKNWAIPNRKVSDPGAHPPSSHPALNMSNIKPINSRYVQDVSSVLKANQPAIPDVIHELPTFINAHIQGIYDVRPDGHCGYRAIAASLGRNEEDFMQIRKQLYQEIQNRREFYIMDSTIDDIEDIENSLIVTSSRPCLDNENKWMTMPAMAAPIANAFQTPVFFFSEYYSHTALPHFCGPNRNPPIIIAYIHGLRHFVVLQLTNIHLFPAPRPTRNRHPLPRHEKAHEWLDIYASCFNMLDSMTPATGTTLVIDD